MVLTSGSDSYSFVNRPDDLRWRPDSDYQQICSLATVTATATMANNCLPWKTFPEAGKVAVGASQRRCHPVEANCESCLFYFI